MDELKGGQTGRQVICVLARRTPLTRALCSLPHEFANNSSRLIPVTSRSATSHACDCSDADTEPFGRVELLKMGMCVHLQVHACMLGREGPTRNPAAQVPERIHWV